MSTKYLVKLEVIKVEKTEAHKKGYEEVPASTNKTELVSATFETEHFTHTVDKINNLISLMKVTEGKS